MEGTMLSMYEGRAEAQESAAVGQTQFVDESDAELAAHWSLHFAAHPTEILAQAISADLDPFTYIAIQVYGPNTGGRGWLRQLTFQEDGVLTLLMAFLERETGYNDEPEEHYYDDYC
jgi:hypothetical protein